MPLTKKQSMGEEIANAVSHGAGAIFGIVALILMLIKSSSTLEIISSIVFGFGIIMLYTMSTLYHAFKKDSTVKKVFKRLDHSSVYLLIGATYSPIYILVLAKPLGWILLIASWAVIIAGIVLKATIINRFTYVHLAMYLILGWSGIFFFGSVYVFSAPAFYLILGGGIAYTVGVIFYALRLFKYSHFVWHLFVIIGTVLHFIAIYFHLF